MQVRDFLDVMVTDKPIYIQAYDTGGRSYLAPIREYEYEEDRFNEMEIDYIEYEDGEFVIHPEVPIYD